MKSFPKRGSCRRRSLGKEQAMVCEDLAVFRQPSVLALSARSCTCRLIFNVICSGIFCSSKYQDYSGEQKPLYISVMVILMA